MPETVLVLPLLLVILGMVLYFGRGMLRLQRAQVMDRAEAWRLPHHPTEASLDDALRPPNRSPGPRVIPPHADGLNAKLNQAFLGNKADAVEGDVTAIRFDQAINVTLEAANGHSTDARVLAETYFSSFPSGQRPRFKITYTAETLLWQQFESPMAHGSLRLGHDWNYANGWRALRITWGDALSRFRTMEPYPDDDPMLATKLVLYPHGSLPPTVLPGDGAGGVVIPRSYGYDVWQHTAPITTALTPIRVTFFQGFDDVVAPLAETNALAREMRKLYTAVTEYRGPTLETPPPE